MVTRRDQTWAMGGMELAFPEIVKKNWEMHLQSEGKNKEVGFEYSPFERTFRYPGRNVQ